MQPDIAYCPSTMYGGLAQTEAGDFLARQAPAFGVFAPPRLACMVT